MITLAVSRQLSHYRRAGDRASQMLGGAQKTAMGMGGQAEQVKA